MGPQRSTPFPGQHPLRLPQEDHTMSRDHCVTFRDNRDSSCDIRSPPPSAPIISPPQTISFWLGAPGTSALQGQEGARAPRALSSSCLLFFSLKTKQTTSPLVPPNIQPWRTIKKSVFESKTVLFEGVRLYRSAPLRGDLIDLT